MAYTDEERQLHLILITVILTSVSVLAVLMRIILRFFVIRNPGMDDYTIVIATFFTVGYMLEILLQKENKIGFPGSTLTMDQMVNQLKVTLAIEATYYLIVGFIKMSIIYLYLRFAVSEIFRYLCYGTIVFEVIITAISLCVTFGQCSPLHKMWDLTGTVAGSCINTTAFFYSTSGINIVTDIWILALPIKTLRLINRPLRERIALAIIFGAGAVAATMSCVRLQSIYVYTLATDPFRDGIAINVWSMLEVNIAILCASVPSLKPLCTPRRIRDFRSRKQYQYRAKQDDDPFKIENQNSHQGSGPCTRKPSNTSLYPDLETYNLTTISQDRDSPKSATFAPETSLRPPPSARARLDPYDLENDDLSSTPNQPTFHAM